MNEKLDQSVRNLIEQISDGYPIGEHISAGPYIEYPGKGFNRICLGWLDSKTPEVLFGVSAGDTASQAKSLYQHFTIAKAERLIDLGWKVENNFHLAWWMKNIISFQGEQSLTMAEYIDFGKECLREGWLRKFDKPEFEELTDLLRSRKIMSAAELRSFDEYFRTHKYQSAIVCPSVNINIRLSIDWIYGDKRELIEDLKRRKRELIEVFGIEEHGFSGNRSNGSEKAGLASGITTQYKCDLCGDFVRGNERIAHQREEHPRDKVIWQVVQ